MTRRTLVPLTLDTTGLGLLAVSASFWHLAAALALAGMALLILSWRYAP
jgi:hypothetical protein